MRSVFVFPAMERDEAAALLDLHLPRYADQWTLDGNLYIEIEDERNGYLFRDWEPEDVAVLEAAAGRRPAWAVSIDISGRIPGTAEACRVAGWLLERGGFAVDDYSAHPWTLQEIESGAVVDGLRFFDYLTYHERHHGPAGS
jgi:hypothetical protein